MTGRQCDICKNYKGDFKCDAFKGQIPPDIITGQFTHDKPHEEQINDEILFKKGKK